MIARLLLACAMRLVPGSERDWAKAMESELASIDDASHRARWSAGCLGAALRIRAESAEGRFEVICAAILALLTLVDWNSPDPTLVIAALAVIPALLAYCRPCRCRQVGLLFGLWLLAAHGLADVFAMLRPAYQHLPLSPAEFVEIALLLGVTIPAAAFGASLRRAAS
jgi:hypothetical protein